METSSIMVNTEILKKMSTILHVRKFLFHFFLNFLPSCGEAVFDQPDLF